MANSSMLFGPNNTSKLLQNQILTRDGALINTGGAKNYIRNGAAELGQTTGWVVSKNTVAAASPDSGFVTTGTSNTIAASSTSPLYDNYSFILTLAAQGNQYYYDFTIDAAAKGKVLQGVIQYAISSGTFADDSLSVWIYDITNASFIQPAPYLFKNHSLPSDNLPFEFQTASNSTSYRLVIHQAAASTAVLKVDGIFVGQTAKLYGSPITDTQSRTPVWTNLTVGSPTTNIEYYRRSGDNLEVNLTFTSNTGFSVGGIISVDIPSGLAIDTNKIETNGVVGEAQAYSGTGFYSGSVQVISSTTVRFTGPSNTTAWTTTVPFTWGTGAGVSLRAIFKVPIVGWSSSTVMSSDAATSVVAARATRAVTDQTISSASPTTIIFNAVSYDTNGAFDAATGIYTVKVPGYYRVSSMIYGSLLTSGEAYSIDILKNAGSFAANIQRASSAGDAFFIASGTAYFLAGDTIKVNIDSAADTSYSVVATGSASNVAIERISGPAQIAASDTISGRWYASGTVISGSDTTIVWSTKDYDDLSIHSSGNITIPSPGKYQFQSALQMLSTFTAVNQAAQLSIFKNGAQVSQTTLNVGSTSQTNLSPIVSDIIRCLAGDIITIRANCAGTSPSINASNVRNYVSWARIGNY